MMGLTMGLSHWHKLYRARIDAPRELIFELTSDLPNYRRWLPQSEQYGDTTDVEPYPVRLGTRYHDGKPTSDGKHWWGTVTAFTPPAALDFHHTIRVPEALATVEVHIHYSFEHDDGGTELTRWLVLDITMPLITRPVRRLITSSFDTENIRVLAALKEYAEASAQ
jgi:uncharacterized protein YndB with AHSA1/START domain